MKLADLITDAGTGQCSHTKLWTHIAYLATTVAFLRLTLFSPTPLSVEIWLVYLGIVGSHGLASKYISMKYASHDHRAKE